MPGAPRLVPHPLGGSDAWLYDLKGQYDEYAAASVEPLLLYTAHAAPMQLVFYSGEQFPDAYAGDAFVTMRGSWNRKPPSGYEIVRVRFDGGEPVAFEPFVRGFVDTSGEEAEHFGRLVGLVQAPDGALLFSDDTGGVIYRLSHDGSARTARRSRNPFE